jgi:hypothetical protein
LFRSIMNIKIANESGVVLLLVMVVIVVISITLPAYVTWTVWEQKNLIRKQSADYAHLLAQAGLNRALVDLGLDDNWIDGNINGNDLLADFITPCDPSPCTPDDTEPDKLFLLYNDITTFDILATPFIDGIYEVRIRYLYDAGGSPYSTMIWVRSTGTTTDATGILATSTLEQLVNTAPVKNIGLDRANSADDGAFYPNLQSAIDGDDLDLNDTIAITGVTLNEIVNIDSGPHFYIRGCYGYDFLSRDCTNFDSIINGSINVTGSADVDIGGVTIN